MKDSSGELSFGRSAFVLTALTFGQTCKNNFVKILRKKLVVSPGQRTIEGLTSLSIPPLCRQLALSALPRQRKHLQVQQIHVGPHQTVTITCSSAALSNNTTDYGSFIQSQFASLN